MEADGVVESGLSYGIFLSGLYRGKTVHHALGMAGKATKFVYAGCLAQYVAFGVKLMERNGSVGVTPCGCRHRLCGGDATVMDVINGNSVIRNIVPNSKHTTQQTRVLGIQLMSVKCAWIPFVVQSFHIEIVGIISGSGHNVGCP